MLRWNISYPDTFKCNIDNIIFTIVYHTDKKYHVYIRAKIGDEYFDKAIHTPYDTLQEANQECESIYERMNRK